jgi:uncharacterized protein (TIGR03067 family)
VSPLCETGCRLSYGPRTHCPLPARAVRSASPSEESAMRRVLPLLVVACLAFAPAPVYREKPKQPRGGPSGIQGRWKVISRSIGGEATPHDTSLLEVADGRWVYSNAAGTWRSSWTYSLDAKATPWGFRAQSEKLAVAKQGGVCVVEGDKLTMCYTMEGAPATDLDGKKWGRHLDVFQRIKP